MNKICYSYLMLAEMGHGERENNKRKAVEVNYRNSLELSPRRNCRGETASLVVGMNVREDRDAN